MHFLRKTSRASPCSRCWSAPNWQVAIFCFASTAKHGHAGKSTIRAAARKAQRDMLNPGALKITDPHQSKELAPKIGTERHKISQDAYARPFSR
jgi:hypothetical protein